MNYSWESAFRSLFDRCVSLCQSGKTSISSWFSAEDQAFLKSIGCRERELFDFVEDHCHAAGGEPTAETALLIAAARRDYLNVMQRGQASAQIVPPAALPAKTAALHGIVWLPRIIAKARAKLRGEMDPDTMFGCGGDRAFLSRHDIHPADFLRAVWAAGEDEERIFAFVQNRGRWA